ncbi:hypothetical protein PTKIN_Ptkin05aG0134500 [Pterospermum kingtungense]
MVGTGLQFGNVRGEDRFYIPVKARKNQNQKQQQKQKQQVVKEDNKQCSSKSSAPLTKSLALASDDDSNKKKAKETLVSSSIQGSEESGFSRSNFERFLESTRPLVPAQYFSKTTVRGWRTCDVEFQPYFTLCDLWESFKEWSAYGAGVPLVLDGSDSVVQYYVPYLSGIQLYGESMQPNAKPRLAGVESEIDYFRDSSSDGSSDYKTEKGIKFSGELHNWFNSTNEITSGVSSLSMTDESSTLQEGFSSDDSEAGNSQDHLLFEFFERDTPYSREPLADKIFDLACKYSGLKTLRSYDLLPVSWISVAWYPICRIPTGPTLKDLDACFLTYHSLSTPMEGSGSGQTPFVIYPTEADGVPKISLPVFGMASYKFKGSMWTQNGVSERQHANSLMQAAENWLRLLQVNHPDFQFFASHGMYIW